MQEFDFVDGQNLVFAGIQFRRSEISVKSAFKISFHKVIYIERFIVSSCFSS